jgi:hypothetical protein
LRDFPYEFEFANLAIGGSNCPPLLRDLVDGSAGARDLDALTAPDDRDWEELRKPYPRY